MGETEVKVKLGEPKVETEAKVKLGEPKVKVGETEAKAEQGEPKVKVGEMEAEMKEASVEDDSWPYVLPKKCCHYSLKGYWLQRRE